MADAADAAAALAACPPQQPPPPEEQAAEQEDPATLEVLVKWSGTEYSVRARPTDTVAHLKRELQRATAVDAKRLKLLGLKAKPAAAAAAAAAVDDGTPLGDLALRPGQRLMMMGQRDEAIAALEVETARAAAVRAAAGGDGDDDDDEGGGGGDDDDSVPLAQRPEIQEKLRRRIEAAAIDVLHPPRAMAAAAGEQNGQDGGAANGAAAAAATGGGEVGAGAGATTTVLSSSRSGYKCLVLDIDYTLFDLGSSAERPEQLARPYLHEFLERCYRFYGEERRFLFCLLDPVADAQNKKTPPALSNPQPNPHRKKNATPPKKTSPNQTKQTSSSGPPPRSNGSKSRCAS
jgi:ubiquitin-like domain-containing CTD phosphatase 1